MECTQLCNVICGLCMCIYLNDIIYIYTIYIYDIYILYIYIHGIYIYMIYIYIYIELPYITNWDADPGSFFQGKRTRDHCKFNW